MPVEIEVELSAVASRPCPRSISRLAPLLAEEADRVADVGCGYLAGTRELLRHHQRVYAIDTTLQEKRIDSRLAAIQTNPNFAGFRTSDLFSGSKLRLGGAYAVNVLHTLPTPKAREALLQSTQRNLRTGGFVVIDVPAYEHYYSERMRPENAFGDGYIFSRYKGRKTFYRFCKAPELDAWAANAQLTFDRAVADHHHLVRIYRRI